MVGLRRGDPPRRRRRALQLPRRIEAERRRRGRERGRSRPAACAARIRRRGRLVPRLSSGGAPCVRARRDPPLASAPDRHLDHPVRSRRPLAATRPPPSSRCRRGRERSSGSLAANPTVHRCSSVARSGSGSPASSARSGPWRRCGAATADGELVDVSMLEALAMCLTYYPVTFHDQLGRPMRATPVRPDPGRRDRTRRAGGAGVRDRATVARLLRDGRTPRVDGGSEALPGPHGAGADDRCLGRGAHRR